MSKQKLPEHATAEKIADSAMRFYGHPWHARTTLIYQVKYLDEIGIAPPKNMDSALELLAERASGKTTTWHKASVWSNAHSEEQEYIIADELAKLGAPIAPSGRLTLSTSEQAELDQFCFTETFSKAMGELADAIYETRLVTVVSPAGREYKAWVGEVEKCMRGTKSKPYTWGKCEVVLRDENGEPLRDKRGNERTLGKASIKQVKRNGLLDKYDYMYQEVA